MLEFDAIIPDYEMIQGSYVNVDKGVSILSSIFNEEITHEPSNKNIILGFSIGDTPERIQKTYEKHKLLPIYYTLGDPDSTEIGLTKEVREFDMILTFGDSAQTPRRQPTELIYRAKKMKNKFSID